MTKYIFITGGVVSSLGKGIIGASLGKLLRARGFSVAIQKFDASTGTLNVKKLCKVFTNVKMIKC